MKYLSVCSGIEAATVAWHPLGWEAAAYSEIEKFPSAVLSHHYPTVPNLGDMTKFKEWDLDSVDLLVGGTPCQSFSVAGLRKGLEDPRGNLALVYCGILDRFRPQWFVWENVPGVLSSNGGRDFGSFLGALAELGYGFAYRVLDAQYFGVAQRRRRVFVVGYFGDWRPAAEVLFEPESVRGDPAPSRKKREEVAGTIAARFGISRNNHEECVAMPSVAKCIITRTRLDPETENFIALAENTIGRQPQNGGNGDGFTEGGPMYTLNATGVHGVAHPVYMGNAEGGAKEVPFLTCQNLGLGISNQTPLVGQPMAFTQNTRDEVRYINGDGAIAGALAAQSGMKQTNYIMQPMAYNIAPGKGALKDDIHVTYADATKTLDASGSNPAMHQGGAAIVHPILLGGWDYENNAHGPDDVTGPLLKGSPTGGGRPLPAIAIAQAISFSGQMSVPSTGLDITPTLQAKNPMAVAQPIDPIRYGKHQQDTLHHESGIMSSLPAGSRDNGGHYTNTVTGMAVRRLSPKECERLQGFPDGYTDIRLKDKDTPDGPRYKALGNSMAVPVMAWIGRRINDYEKTKISVDGLN